MLAPVPSGVSDSPWRLVARRVVITLLLLLAAFLLWYSGIRKAEPEDPTLVDSAIEQLVPDRGATAVRQAEIGIDLAPGWTGVLIINGKEIPEDQLRRVDPLNQVFFRPAEGREIEALPPGRVVVTAVIWRPVDGETREQGRSRSWEFRVA